MRLAITFSEKDKSFITSISETQHSFNADMGSVYHVTQHIGGELYRGEYSVTPRVGSQTIQTKGKVMLKDVTINPIPFFNVSNTSGGDTVYIAKEM